MNETLNKHKTASDVHTMLYAVVCPNLCFNGIVKILEYERSLYDLIKCPYCKGKGKVSEQEAKRIDALLLLNLTSKYKKRKIYDLWRQYTK